MKTPRIAPPLLPRVALAAIIALLAPASSVFATPGGDKAKCLDCHNAANIPPGSFTLPGTRASCKAHGLTWTSAYGCCDQHRSHCTEDKSRTGLIEREPLLDFIENMPTAGATGATGKPGATGKTGTSGTPIVYWCESSTGKVIAEPPGKHTKWAKKVPKADSPCKKYVAPAVAYWCDATVGKITAVPPGKVPAGAVKVPKKNSPCTVVAVVQSTGTSSGASTVVVSTPAVVGIALIDAPDKTETRWLTKNQFVTGYTKERAAATSDAARKVVDDKYRALVKAQIRPEAKSAYAAAIAPTVDTAKIKAAIGGLEMWGGKVTAPVGFYQVKAASGAVKILEIQLSQADWVALNTPPAPKDSKAKKAPELKGSDITPDKYTPAGKAYVDARGGSDGNVGTSANPAFGASVYDPIALRLSVVAALTKLGKAPKEDAGGTNGDATSPVSKANLTKEEMELLTPDELTKYLGLLKAANATPPNKSAQEALEKMNGELRGRIAAEGRKPYAAPKDAKEFEALKPWQKAQFCKPSTAAAATTEADPTKSGGDGNRGKALPALIDLAGQISARGGITSTSPSWATDACGKFKGDQALKPGGNNGGDPSKPTVTAGDIPTPNGEDKDDEAKKESKWLTEPLVIIGVQGALVGLLIGSLFGPVGLLVGALVGAAVFYGATKLKE